MLAFKLNAESKPCPIFATRDLKFMGTFSYKPFTCQPLRKSFRRQGYKQNGKHKKIRQTVNRFNLWMRNIDIHSF